MKIDTIKSGDKTLAFVYLQNLDYRTAGTDKMGVVSNLSEDIEDTKIGYAGFHTKDALRDYLMKVVFDKTVEEKSVSNCILDKNIILKSIKRAVTLCFDALPDDAVHIFVFPTFSRFVEKKMSGTTGYTPWKNTILAFVNQLSQRWERSLIETIAHEYNHSVFFQYHKCQTLLDSIIFEGLAEHFREQVVGGGRAPWSKAVDKNQSKKILGELKSEALLSSADPEIYQNVFFEGKKYVQWTGYTIGYYIVESFLRLNPNLGWKDIMQISPHDIFSQSEFLK